MSEEVGKALQSVVDRVNQAAARRPKVTSAARAAPRYVRTPPPLDGSHSHNTARAGGCPARGDGTRLVVAHTRTRRLLEGDVLVNAPPSERIKVGI